MLNQEHIADIHSKGISKTKQVLDSVDNSIREKQRKQLEDIYAVLRQSDLVVNK